MNTKTITIAVVLIVVIAGVSAFLLMDNGDDYDPEVDVTKPGTVYGNLNQDCYIDSTDVKLIEEIVADEKTSMKDKLKNNLLADVNHDGVIDAADIELVKDIAAKKAKTLDAVDTSGKTVKVDYPLKDVFLAGGTNTRVVSNVLGMDDILKGVATNSKNQSHVLDSDLIDGVKSGKIMSLTLKAETDDLAKLTTMGAKVAVFENGGINNYTQEGPMKVLNDNGIAVFLINSDDFYTSLNAVSTLGILMGAEDAADDYLKLSNGVIDTIGEKLGDRFGTSSVMTVTMTNSVSGTDSDYYAASVLAGGKNLADFTDKTLKFDVEKGQTWLFEPKYNPDYLIHFKSMSYGEKELTSKDVSGYKKNFDQTKAYENGNYYLINGVLPLPVRLAYMSEIMYPDTYAPGWAASVFQEYIDLFTDNPGWDVNEHKVIWSVSDF